jgi:hypothetical protein
MTDNRAALADAARSALLADFAEHGASVIARLEGREPAKVIPITARGALADIRTP